MLNVILRPKGNYYFLYYQTTNCCVLLNTKTYILTKKFQAHKRKRNEKSTFINPFHATSLFLYPLKTLKKKRFSEVLGSIERGQWQWNELI